MSIKYVYVTKSVRGDMTAHEGFKYPESGIVKASDWEATKVWGNGLHGFLWGEGSGNLAHYTSSYKWLLIRVNPADGLVVMPGECKFRKGYVVSVGDYKSITKELVKYMPNDRVYTVIGLTQRTRDNSISVVGDYGIAISRENGTSKSGYNGTSKSGSHGTSKSGENGISKSGDWGTSISGINGTSKSGAWGTSISGDSGTAQSDEGGVLIISCWFGGKYCRKVGHIGEDGLKPNTKYKLDNNNNFMEVVEKKEEKCL